MTVKGFELPPAHISAHILSIRKVPFCTFNLSFSYIPSILVMAEAGRAVIMITVLIALEASPANNEIMYTMTGMNRLLNIAYGGL